MSHIDELNTYESSDTLIFDNIHGYIEIDDVAKSIIDTPEFQRLRRIHQDGVLHYVFPTANHSRFEHSIGTYYLAKKMVRTIANKQPELNITSDILKVVSLAGLCHDLGHLMYSHLFDDLFLSKLKKDIGELAEHENRSIFILENIISKYKIDISDTEFRVIADLIHPDNINVIYNLWDDKFKKGKWIFEIVSNPKNNIDVDKFDYINRDNKAIGLKLDVDFTRLILQARVINDEICYPIQSRENLYHLFFVRYQLHRRIYHHKTVKAIEILILDILVEFEKTYHISDYLKDPEKINLLVDSYIFHTDNTKINSLINKIETRQLPSLVFENISLEKYNLEEEKFKDIDINDYKIVRYKAGYSSDPNNNPLSKIKFYKTKDKMIISETSVENFSLLTNNNHQEFVCRVYCKNNLIKEKLFNLLN